MLCSDLLLAANTAMNVSEYDYGHCMMMVPAGHKSMPDANEYDYGHCMMMVPAPGQQILL
jgi:hypothetical protein